VRDRHDSFLDTINGLKDYDQHHAEVEAELYAACSDAAEVVTAMSTSRG